MKVLTFLGRCFFLWRGIKHIHDMVIIGFFFLFSRHKEDTMYKSFVYNEGVAMP